MCWGWGHRLIVALYVKYRCLHAWNESARGRCSNPQGSCCGCGRPHGKVPDSSPSVFDSRMCSLEVYDELSYMVDGMAVVTRHIKLYSHVRCRTWHAWPEK